MATLLIVNADDLGYDPAIDEGILQAHARGIVTAASAMVDTPFAARAVAEAPASLDLGLHVVLPVPCRGAQLEEEIARQLATFRALRGARPSHIDSHRHAHAAPSALQAFAEAAREEGIPLRALDAGMRGELRIMGVATTDGFVGDAGLRPCWTPARLIATVEALPAGVVEMMCHPGRTPTHVRTSFGAEREIELAALCEPRVRASLSAAGVALRGFAAAFPSGSFPP
jgi:predicted glycoside hydrolase/deacetylase ChbG (UPF0249 family)